MLISPQTRANRLDVGRNDDSETKQREVASLLNALKRGLDGAGVLLGCERAGEVAWQAAGCAESLRPPRGVVLASDPVEFSRAACASTSEFPRTLRPSYFSDA